jgi:hypothetical protein
MMILHTIIRPAVGADLSALGGCSDIQINKLQVIIGPKWIS